MPIILIVIKASLLLAAGLAGAWLLRAAPAVTRHALWSATFAALLALPWLGGALPVVSVPVPAVWAARAPDCLQLVPGLVHFCVPQAAGTDGMTATPETAGVPIAATVAAPAVSAGAVAGGNEHASPWVTRSPAVPAIPSIGAVARIVWLAGACAASGALLLSLLRVRRLARTAVDVADPAWHEAVHALGVRLALRRPARLVVSHAVRTPMAGGVWRPVIFLPADAPAWTAERRDVVLAHELSHIAGRDPLRHLAARLAVACYWFHPLAWLAARQSSLAREQACDEAVLALGIRPSEYARVLLDLAETMAPARQPAAALPMVERSILETRLMAILDPQTRPSRLRRPFVPAAGAALLAVALASVQPLARSVDIHSPASSAARPSIAMAAAGDAIDPAVPASPAFQTGPTSACRAADNTGDFNGYSNTDAQGTIVERVGTSGTTRIIQQRFGALRVCMLAQDAPRERTDRPSAWLDRAGHVVIETSRSSSSVQLEIRRQGGGTQTAWRVNGADRPLDASAQAWREAITAVLDRTWDIASLRGEESSLRGDISSLHGDESSLRGDISSIHGDISSLRGDQSSIRGDESSLRGDISSIQGDVSSLRGQISSEQGSISSLTASRFGASDTDRARVQREVERHEAEIERIQRELREYDAASKIAAVEKSLRALDADAKIAAIETEIQKYGESAKVREIEKQIEALNVAGKTAEIERRITALDVDRRTRQMQNQLDDAIKRLERALAAIR